MRKAVSQGAVYESEWKVLFARYAQDHAQLAAEFQRAADRKLPEDWIRLWQDGVPKFEPGTGMATREAQGKVLDAIMPHMPLVIGGSADLTPSNNTRFKGVTDFSRENPGGRYIRFGVREHAMGAILNGIALSDMLIPYGATFFAFLDYMRGAVRLAAISRYPSIFIYTHDSIGLGEDGPTHQAVEQFASLRAMPGIVVLRPADATETAAAWKFALEHRDGPVAIALTRQKVPVIDRTVYASADNLERGAYILTSAADPKVVLIATGSEVGLAVQAHDRLAAENIPSRVVSMPSWELFERQPQHYRNEVLPPEVTARVAVEAGVRMGWERYLGSRGEFVGMSTFGASAPLEAVFAGFGITVDAVVNAAKRSMA
jgi:transketolase